MEPHYHGHPWSHKDQLWNNDEITNKDESKSKIVLKQRQQLCHQITCISTRTTIISKIENIVPINIICSSNVSFSYPLKFLIIFKAMMSYVTRDDCSGQVSICVHKQVNDWLPMDSCMETYDWLVGFTFTSCWLILNLSSLGDIKGRQNGFRFLWPSVRLRTFMQSKKASNSRIRLAVSCIEASPYVCSRLPTDWLMTCEHNYCLIENSSK